MKKENIKKFLQRIFGQACSGFKSSRHLQVSLMLGVLLLIGYTVSQCSGTVEKVYVSSSNVDFKQGRLLDNQDADFYKKRDHLQTDKIRKILETQDVILDRLNSLETKPSKTKPQPSSTDSTTEDPPPQIQPNPNAAAPIRLYDSSDQFEVQGADTYIKPIARTVRRKPSRIKSVPKKADSGFSVVSFPVKKTKKQEIEITLPPGSFVKAKILTGVDAPQGKAYPSLLALDYAFIAPNNYRIDLSGCFVIAKAQGDLSTERVQMQPTKLSCVSKTGSMFEREINGYVADQNDNNFALRGKLNSKQGRVMSMAFLSSVVEGIGNAVKQAQVTESTNAVGGSNSILTGDEGKYIAAGGASNAASQVTQWYLGQAQNLLPTINVGAGQDVWVVVTDKVELPNDYFLKNKRGKNDHSQMEYLSRLFN